MQLNTDGEGFQRVERRGGRLLDGDVEPRDAGQRLPELFPQGGHAAAESGKHVLFAIDLHLLTGEHVAVRAIHRLQRDDVARAERSNRPGQHRLDVLPLTDLTRRRARRAAPRGERPMNRSDSCTRSSETTLRNGDCRSCTVSACLNASSNTGSPVLFVMSAIRISSSVVSAGRSRRPEIPDRDQRGGRHHGRNRTRQPATREAVAGLAACTGCVSVARRRRRSSARISEAVW